MELKVVSLHSHPQYMMDCCHLINSEWKRSDAARIHSLQSSCDQLPTSLVLLQNDKVIGHLKLTPIPSLRDACFVESVVIEPELRGKGYGTLFMKRAEEYCKDFLSLHSIYLSTKDRESFYSKLGYTKCPPISIYGSNTLMTAAPRQKVDSVTQNCGPPPPPLPVNKIRASITLKTFMKKQIQ